MGKANSRQSPRVLVTGAKGFVGRHLVRFLMATGVDVVEISSRATSDGTRQLDLGADSGWKEAMDGVDVIVHLAARVHMMDDSSRNPLESFRKINVEGTLRIAGIAAAAGVGRFVYISSIKALGEWTSPGNPFVTDQNGQPLDPYGISKAEAEDTLMARYQDSGLMEIVVIRPPLIYGKGVKGNLATLQKLVKGRVPLPLGSVSNKRDLVGIGNLCDLIGVVLAHPNAAGHRFVVSDGTPLSTAELIRMMAEVQGIKPALINISPKILKWALAGIGKSEVWSRIGGDLEVDISETCRILKWRPRFSFMQGVTSWLT